MTFYEIAEITTNELFEYLVNNFSSAIPSEVNSIEDAEEVSRLLSKTANSYMYLSEVYAYLKFAIRNAKREEQPNKNKIDDLVDKKEIVDRFISALKLQYQAASRMITIRENNLKELDMCKSI